MQSEQEKRETFRTQVEKVEGKLYVIGCLAESLNDVATENKGGLDAALGTEGLQISMKSILDWCVEGKLWLDDLRALHDIPRVEGDRIY